jgi:hypothetical protein
MPRAFLANALDASVHDALDPLSERGRGVGWRKEVAR